MSKLVLRKATKDDIWLLYEWANDPATRKNALHTHTISREEHEKWFEMKMIDPNCHIYIYQVDDVPVGQVRVDICDRMGEVDYYIKPEFRGFGHAKCMLKMMEQLEIDSVDKIVARVKISNVASQHALAKVGFMSDELIRYEKEPMNDNSYKIFDSMVQVNL